MNKWIGMGRATKDADVRYTSGEKGQMAIARYTLAVDRVGKDAGADFINITAFGKAGEFAEKYIKKGTKLVVCGRIQTGSYEKDGSKVYTTDVIAETQEFAESKKDTTDDGKPTGFAAINDFVHVEEDADLPFAPVSR